MKRSTNSAPDCLSTSYLIGSAFIGISMITLNSSGTCFPAVTSLMLIERRFLRGSAGELRRGAHYNPVQRRALGRCARAPGQLRRTRAGSVDGDRARLGARGEG